MLFRSQADAEWTGKVVHAEDLGSDNYLFVDIGVGDPLVVRRTGKLETPLGTELNLRPIAGQIHRFDANEKPIR